MDYASFSRSEETFVFHGGARKCRGLCAQRLVKALSNARGPVSDYVCGSERRSCREDSRRDLPVTFCPSEARTDQLEFLIEILRGNCCPLLQA